MLMAMPDIEFLPESLHDLARAFEAADDRLDDLEDKRAEAHAAVAAGRAADGEAIKKYALEGGPVPKRGEHEAAARATLAQAEEAVKIAERAKLAAGVKLVRAARGTEARDAIATAVAAAVRPAVAEYRETLADVAKRLQAARAKVEAVAEYVGFVNDLDEGGHYVGFGSPARLPDLAPADHTKALDRIAAAAEAIEGARPAPAFREVEGIGRVKADHIPALARARDGELVPTDGLGPIEVPEFVSTGVSRASRVAPTLSTSDRVR